MRIVVDTNVVISAIIRDNVPEKIISWIVSQPTIEWIASAGIIQEYREVLQRKKFKLSNEIIIRWLNLFAKELTVIQSDFTINFPRDIKDAKFLECAVAGYADVFITGDKDFSEAQKLIETQIMSIAEFNAVFLK
jgi:putative PIN family toxin of toxin-antitoxin system